ncbi:MAG: hypothetical protein H7Z19_12610 [Chitinophagaceae bacterium]|nr:hypothetical protein [Rubrivivax sp.]
MTAFKLIHILAVGSAAILLSACGGGDGDSGGAGGGGVSPPGATAPPTSGAYNWVLKAEGPTSQLKFGLSLVHPTTPGTEWVIEAPNAAVTDAKVVASGTVDASTQTVSALRPFALVYIVGGDVRRVPLQANGSAPKPQAQSSQTSSVCGFVLDAVDHGAPEMSRFIVATAGADGQCNTADDGAAEVRLSNTAPGISVTPISGARPLAVLRDPSTLAPRGWVAATQASFWAPGPGQTVNLRPTANPLLRVVAGTYRTVLAEAASGLSVFDFSGGTSFTESAVAGVGTTGWQPIGHDAQYFYAYRNSGNETGTWQVLRVLRAGGGASVLGGGNGAVSVASLGRDYVYVTVLGVNNNQLARMNKLVPSTTAQILETTPRSTLTTVVTSANDVHQRWRVTGVGTANPAYVLEFFDEAGATLFSSTGGGFPLLLAGGNSLNFNASENRSIFVVADRYGARAFGNASVVVMDTQARTARTMGALPGTSEFGADFVFASASGGPGSAMAGFAGRSVNGVVQGAGARVFSFDAATASSLKYTSQQQ